MSALHLLEESKRVLEDPMRWSKGATAKSRSGQAVEPHSPEAVARDLEGTLLWTAKKLGRGDREVKAAKMLLFPHCNGHGLHYWNDSPAVGHRGLMRRLDRAIDRAKGH